MGFSSSTATAARKSVPINGGNAATTSGTPNTSQRVFESNVGALERGLANLSGNPAAIIYLGLGQPATVGNGPAIRPGDPPWVSTTFTGTVDHISAVASVPFAIYEI